MNENIPILYFILGFLFFLLIFVVLYQTIQIRNLKTNINELEKQVITDPKTGVYNYRGLNLLLHREIERTKRTESPLSAIFLDLDHFKQINDSYGHALGDIVLGSLRHRILRIIRSIDVLGRYGGEEFVILLPETSLSRAAEIAERIRQEFEKHPIDTTLGDLLVTFSLGVTVWHADDTAQSFIERADHAMYLAKQNGRNRVEIAE